MSGAPGTYGSLADIPDRPVARVAVVVPYRESAEGERAPQLRRFLEFWRSEPGVELYVVEQSQDGRKFNRGALLNVGAKYAFEDGHRSLILHDVDLLPDPDLLPLYHRFPAHPIHVGWAWTEKYKHDRFLGGILSISKTDFLKVDGFPNHFWGWGGEDDALRERLFRHGVPVLRPAERGGVHGMRHTSASDNPATANTHKHADLRRFAAGGLSDLRFQLLTFRRPSRNARMFTVVLADSPR